MDSIEIREARDRILHFFEEVKKLNKIISYEKEYESGAQEGTLIAMHQ